MQRPLLIYEKVSYIFHYICRVKEMQVQMREIVLSLDAEGGILTAAAGHEVFHYLKENAANAAESLQKFILHRLLASEGFNLNAELAKYRDRYALETQGMTEKEQRIYLLEELTADSMFGVFSSKQAVELYAKQQPKDAKKVAKAIRNFYEKVKKALETLSFKGMGTVSALQQQAQTLEQISDLFFAALEEAQANRRQNKNTADQGGAEVKYSRAYESSKANEDILSLINKVKTNDFEYKDRVNLGKVSQRAAEIIKEVTGIDVADYTVAIEARQIVHILNDHGINGMSDHSMANDEDIAKIEYALSSFDSLIYAGKTRAYSYMRNGYNRTADTVLYEKEIGEQSYYVVQAVPEAKKKTLFIVTAFIGQKGYKKEASQLINALSPDATSEFGSATTSNDTVTYISEDVKQNNETIVNSAKLSSDTADYVTRLQQENADLQATLEAARAELHETRGLTISDAELRKISDFFADTLQSDLTREDLFKTLLGKIRFVKNHDGNHATLDTRWSELCALSRGLLDENTPDYAQPEALLDYYAARATMCK